MALRTSFTDLFSIEHPIALAPMGGSAGGALAAAVSNGGGLGLVGGGRGDHAWLEHELAILAEQTDRPWGVGFLSWSASVDVVERVLEHGPHVVMLSFGDPRPLAEPVLDAGVRLMIQVTDLGEAEQAVELGADVIVAQGAEAGGHGGRRATLPFVPVVVDLAAPTPVLAAGGIADGRGLAAALVLGAAGALVGTRFQATAEALVAPEVTKAIVEGRGEDTERSRILDIARGSPWPEPYPARTLRNAFLDRWRGRESELEADEAAKAGYREAAERGDLAAIPVWASEAIDLITDVASATDLVGVIADEALRALSRAGRVGLQPLKPAPPI
jgi:nitronate monooxygenase